MIYNNLKAVLTISESAPPSSMVSLADMKTFLRLTSTGEDTLISSLITTSRQLIERYINKSLVGKVMQVECTHDGIYPLELPYGPVTMTADDVFSISTVFFRVGDRQTWADFTSSLNNLFEFNGLSSCALMGNPGQYRIKYNTSPVTDEIFNTAIKQQVAFFYENRGDEEIYQLGSSRIPTAVVCDMVKITLAGYRRLTWLG